jgi:hypothetical protein
MLKTKSAVAMLTGLLCLSVMVLMLDSNANAECFGSADQWKAVINSTKGKLPSTELKTAALPETKMVQDDNDQGGSRSIVGLWHVHYLSPAFQPFNGDMEAFQIFNAGGTEVHNPNAASNGVCLGTWVQSGRDVKLTHRVWLYDPTGAFFAVGHLEVSIRLTDNGAHQTGTLTMQLFDLAGNAISPEIPGTLSGERIVPKQ